jgi:hypothetical protein
MTQAMVLEELKADWFTDARFMIERLAAGNDRFTADDLRKVMRPAPNRYWAGNAFSQAQAAGLIEWVGYRKSTTKSRKGSPVSIWRRKSEGVQQ